eukprot:5094740-Prymnesium_polylepis.1
MPDTVSSDSPDRVPDTLPNIQAPDSCLTVRAETASAPPTLERPARVGSRPPYRVASLCGCCVHIQSGPTAACVYGVPRSARVLGGLEALIGRALQ